MPCRKNLEAVLCPSHLQAATAPYFTATQKVRIASQAARRDASSSA